MLKNKRDKRKKIIESLERKNLFHLTIREILLPFFTETWIKINILNELKIFNETFENIWVQYMDNDVLHELEETLRYYKNSFHWNIFRSTPFCF